MAWPYDDQQDEPQPTHYQIVGYDTNGNPVYDDGTGKRFTFRSADGTWQPYEDEVKPKQEWTTQPPPPPVKPPPDGGPGGDNGRDNDHGNGSGGAPGGLGSLISPFPGTFTPSPEYHAPNAPQFQGPEWQTPDAFHSPTTVDEQNDPGFQFRMQQGLGALENAAGAKGMSRSGAQFKALQGWGQDYASGEYQNVWNRAADTYKQNYQTQYVDPYMAKYASAVQGYQGQLHGYDTQTAADQRQSELNAQTNWNKYKFDYDAWHAQQWEEFQKRFQVDTA